jgi:hypothetical protein
MDDATGLLRRQIVDRHLLVGVMVDHDWIRCNSLSASDDSNCMRWRRASNYQQVSVSCREFLSFINAELRASP